jgi:hypothetical protein
VLLDDVWPVRGVRVTGPVLDLVVPDEGRLSELAALAADGVYDPQNRYLPRSPVAGWEGGEPLEAQRSFLRYVWAASADWSPRRWNLVLAAVVRDRCVGVQEFGATDFSVVSRALGYQPNGTTVRVWRGQRHEQVDLVLHRRDWVAPEGVATSGLSDDARRFFDAPRRTDEET